MSMIKRDELQPTSEVPTATGSSDLLLGAGAEFEGKLTFRGTVRIDAIFKGQIITNDVLVVGERAKIDAEITCGTVVVHGQVNGNVKAKTAVELSRTARLRGDVETASISIERGALLQGAVKVVAEDRADRTDRPVAGRPGATPAVPAPAPGARTPAV